MRVAALYDIHGNLPALEAVLAEVRRAAVDLVVIGGDVLPGPMPRDCLELLRGLERPTRFIRGNGDREVLARVRGEPASALPEQARVAIDWSASQLDAGHETWLAAWPSTLRVDMDSFGPVRFCHATPKSDTEIFTRLTPDERLAPAFEGVDASLVVCGHTHMPFDRAVGSIRIVNAGSVGMPFGDPGAYWLLLDSAVRPQCTRYDCPRAAERIRATAYPQRDEFAARNVLTPPSEAAMLELFSRPAEG